MHIYHEVPQYFAAHCWLKQPVDLYWLRQWCILYKKGKYSLMSRCGIDIWPFRVIESCSLIHWKYLLRDNFMPSAFINGNRDRRDLGHDGAKVIRYSAWLSLQSWTNTYVLRWLVPVFTNHSHLKSPSLCWPYIFNASTPCS